jgi:hypothetical protein
MTTWHPTPTADEADRTDALTETFRVEVIRSDDVAKDALSVRRDGQMVWVEIDDGDGNPPGAAAFAFDCRRRDDRELLWRLAQTIHRFYSETRAADGPR